MSQENINIKSDRKSQRKQKRASHKLSRDMNIKCCETSTQHLMICNAGLVTGLRREILENIIKPIVNDFELIMPPGKSYSFIKTNTIEDAIKIYNQVHNNIKLEGEKTPLYVTYTETIPSFISEMPSTNSSINIPGLQLIENFISDEEEMILLKTLDWSNEESISSELKHRKVRHYGYAFQYDTNRVDPNDPIDPIPEDYEFLLSRFEKFGYGTYKFDQLTINCYLPGQGIPPHIDTHSVFEDTIVSLSLGSSCVMNFKRDEKKVAILLPPKSLLVMSGESRYAWSHGICPRHNDLVQLEDGFTTQPRGIRISFTFRKVRKIECRCPFIAYCDRKTKSGPSLVDENTATELEDIYVHKVYNEIAGHFNETRHKQWPNVSKFLESLEIGSLVLDVGCGNGKYLQGNPNLFKIGCDHSIGLMQICKNRGFEVFLSNCLHLPYKDNSFDAVISIAVIHHLSTRDRRKQAIMEMARLLRSNGKCLIYVWAKEQSKDSVDSAYLKYGTNKNEIKEDCMKKTEQGLLLPIHENRTKFSHSDMLVPWKRKGGGHFLRYYHVFAEGELFDICSEISSITIQNTYYDEGNWCIILQKNI